MRGKQNALATRKHDLTDGKSQTIPGAAASQRERGESTMKRIAAWTGIVSCVMASTPVHAAAPQASYAAAACPADLPPDPGRSCGVLTVPENRSVPHSRMIRLPVAIYRSTAAHPAPDPVIFLPGGPGISAFAHPLPSRDNPFLAERDYILLEPRGNRLAWPSLDCPQLNALDGTNATGHLSSEAWSKARREAAARCRRSLIGQGVDLRGYTSAETARDIEDLRRALGYPRWNLFGHSYGTRLALTVLRDYPNGVRSVLLDSVLPIEVNFDEAATANLARSLGAVWAGCRADPVCARRHPDPEGDLRALVAKADRHPLAMPTVKGADGKPVTVRGRQVVEALYAGLHDPRQIGHLPEWVADSLAGQTAALAALVRANQGPSSFNWGLRLSVWCAEEMPFEDAARVDDQPSPAWGLAGIDERAASPALCKVWDVPPAASVESRPVKSTAPVLVLSGEFDPDTPPSWARLLQTSLAHARVVVMPGQSHGAGFNRCGAQIEAAFFHAPDAPLPTDCVLTMRDVEFGGGAAQETREDRAPAKWTN
jgi:pimeloyl-ACP methyl ester carboxylesterase